ncbi:class I SAM-dependent methyltransferase [Corallococcus sp. M34]|uniref:class I SAM-dependent methyltransferase n=1 Tax=Citreicoccus inhibens TaxID=2849499 RepID=UPI001C22192F|nr:class I SAM-dependent methyltransferase [Citreicoccus inhibens]MBU8896653.1 class I SAM-dependent methyltransferase [Citreicoccus inhibens]
MMDHGDVEWLACPSCGGRLVFHGQMTEREHLRHGALRCGGCGEAWKVSRGLARLYREGEVRGTDRLMRVIYDGLPALHDPLTAVLTPLLQSVSEPDARDRYMRRVELGALRPRLDGQPTRILEVGVGTGANLPLIHRDLPRGLDVEVWGVDLSEGMLTQCRKRLASGELPRTRLLMADAHALPFPDAMFDRVLHVGGIGGYRQPRVALEEMARVARPGTPLVVVDEQLDKAARPNWMQRLAFRAITFYDRNPHCPRELLPLGATGVVEEQVAPFYYCLTFRVDSPNTRAMSGREGTSSAG